MIDNSLFKSIIHGKTVALVGPAKYMVGSCLGEEIDQHDVVVRINRSIETTKQYSADVGVKTDVLYSCLIETAQNAGKLDVLELKNDYGVKFVCAPPQSDYKGISQRTTFHEMVNMKTVKHIIKVLPLRIVDHQMHTELAKKVQCRPNTGFLAIYDLLNFNPSMLSIYGFSFYLDGFIPGCKSGVEKEKNVTEDEFATMAFNSKRHVQKNIWQYAKDTLRDNPSVKLDSVLDVILNLEKLDKKLFSDAIK
jgi:hypothetical protein